MEFAVDPAKFHDVFAADLPDEQAAVMAATQRPIAELAFSEPNGEPAWKKLPSWAVVATGDRAAGTDIVRSMAKRAGATITEVEGSHVIMALQPQAVTDVILTAVGSSPSRHSPNCVVGKRSRQLVLCPINAQIAHPRAGVLVVPQVLHFLFAILLLRYPRREKSTVSPRAARSLRIRPSRRG